jgi:hypothetical protein
MRDKSQEALAMFDETVQWLEGEVKPA